jgi:hypothetical protein
MKFPEGFLWGYPGFPSITVSYLKTNDFFYSGHCGLPIILLCEFKLLKMKFMSLFCIFTFLIEAFAMLVLRGHYSIDIITGAIFAHYIWEITKNYIYLIDDLTFKKKKESKKILKNEEETLKKNSNLNKNDKENENDFIKVYITKEINNNNNNY